MDGIVTSIEQKRRDCVCVCVCVCVYVYRVWREEAMKSSKTQSVPGNEIPEHLDDGE